MIPIFHHFREFCTRAGWSGEKEAEEMRQLLEATRTLLVCLVLSLGVAATGCGDDTDDSSFDGGDDASTDADEETDSDTDTDADADTDSDTDVDTDTDTDADMDTDEDSDDSEGDPCEGVTCSGHGQCAVLAGESPICVCDAGYELQGATNCVAEEVAEEPCDEAADCVGETVCSLSGECITPTCGTGEWVMGGGSTSEGSECYRDELMGCAMVPIEPRGCDSGLACVPIETRYLADTGHAMGGISACLTPCNPCAPSCDSGRSCFAHPLGGGVCLESLSTVPGAWFYTSEHVLCGGGLAPDLTTSGHFGEGTCLTACRPDVLAAWADMGPTDDSAARSADCPTHTVCKPFGWNNTVCGHKFTCVAGDLLSEGDACGDRPDRLCAAPLTCVSGRCAL